jgi:hypothetical protein
MQKKSIQRLLVPACLTLLSMGCYKSKANNGSSTEGDTASDTVADTESNLDSSYDTQVEPSSDIDDAMPCADAPNYTRCELVTEPDCPYDICIDAVCRSTGCGYDRSYNEPGLSFKVPGTGLTLCYSNSVEPKDCPGVAGAADCGDIPFCGQDAQYRRESKGRFARQLGEDDQPVVEDSLTGLTWHGCISGQSGSDCGQGKVRRLAGWQEALEYCEQSTWGGFDDWRLPNPHALESLLDHIEENPSLDPQAFPGWPQGEIEVCTSSYYGVSEIPDVHRYTTVDLNLGSLKFQPEDEGCCVVCVRGDPPTALVERFERSESVALAPIVTDRVTGLVWQGCPAGLWGTSCDSGAAEKFFWVDALAYCERLEWSGQSDWRLPNVRELRSIVDDRQENNVINQTVFPETPFDPKFWTSTSIPRPPFPGDKIPFGLGRAFVVNFFAGYSSEQFKDPGDEFDTDSESYDPFTKPVFYVRCVRGQ